VPELLERAIAELEQRERSKRDDLDLEALKTFRARNHRGEA
jgi:hypothetical protein